MIYPTYLTNWISSCLLMIQIYYENESFIELEKVVNKELKNLYLCVNRLALNIEKTNLFIFHPSNKPLKYVTIKIHKKAILEKKCIKYF